MRGAMAIDRETGHFRLAVRSGCALLLTIVAGCGPKPHLGEPPQVIVISVDALRADYLAPWRDAWGHTPNLDRFAEESVVFTNALTTWPDTSGSHKSLLYGVYPHTHHTSFDAYPQRERVTAPVQALLDAGYRTAAFFSIGRIARAIGLHHGFETFDAPGRRGSSGFELPPLQRAAAGWLREHSDEPFFLLLHTYQVHAPYLPPPDLLQEALQRRGPFGPLPEGFPPSTVHKSIAWWRQRTTPEDLRLLRTVYEGEVAAVDRWFGRLLSELEELGIADQVAIILVSDHGEALGERGHVGHSRLGDEQIRIPMLMRVPGARPRRVDAPVSLVDVMPTVFELAGVEPPYAFEGISLVPELAGRGSVAADRLRPVGHAKQTALFRGEWKLLFNPTDPQSARLFRLEDGRFAPRFAPNHQREVGDLMRRYAAMVRDSAPLAAQFPVDPDAPTRYSEETLRELRALGYLD